MGYLVRTTCLTCVLIWAVLTVTPLSAQTLSATPAAPNLSPLATPASQTPPAEPASPQVAAGVAVTATTAQAEVLPTPTPIAAADDEAEAVPPADEAPLDGTIIANRSQEDARFFVEGSVYVLTAGRSQGIPLPRPSTVLNLFNCPAATPETQAGCFWDPYLVQQDGFYELYSSPGTSGISQLLLREAGTPPADQVWVQNRTGNTESVVFRSDVYDMPPTSVLEFPVSNGVPAILYVRNCLSLDGQQVCEWAPRTLDAGVYYALVEVSTPGQEPGALIITIDLRPVVADEAVAAAEAPVSPPVGVTCALAVPTLNVRRGPGLQYDIIGKIRTSEGSGTVVATGRSADGLWLTVDVELAETGWITAEPNFVTCDPGVAELPIVEAAVVAAPQPTVAAVAPSPVSTVAPAPAAEEPAPAPEEPTPTSTPEPEQQAPAGYAQLIVNNGFQHEMRFTIDQVFRPFEGPSEYDIQPGASVTLVVFPGQIAFTASSAWSSLSANSDLTVDADQTVHMWLRFEQDAGGSWVLMWQ